MTEHVQISHVLFELTKVNKLFFRIYQNSSFCKNEPENIFNSFGVINFNDNTLQAVHKNAIINKLNAVYLQLLVYTNLNAKEKGRQQHN